MHRVIRSKKAINDIKAISNYIAQDNPVKATEFTKKLLLYIRNTLSLFPFSGRKTDTGLYFLSYRNYNIYYDIIENKEIVLIAHIVNSSQYSAYHNL